MKLAIFALALLAPASALALNCAGYQANMEKNYVSEDGQKKPGKLLKPVIEGLKAAQDLDEKSLTAGDRGEALGNGEEGQAGFENQANRSLDKASGEAEERFCKSLRDVRDRAHSNLQWMLSEKCKIDVVKAEVAKAFAPLEKEEKKICGRNPKGAFTKKKKKG